MPGFFNWPPFKLYAVDADTGKPLDSNVGTKTYVKYYDVKKDGQGRKSLIAHKSGKEAPAEKKQNDTPQVAEAAVTQKQNGEKKAVAEDNNWNDELDEKLEKLAAENTPWAEIATAIGKPVKQCKKRFFNDLKMQQNKPDKSADQKTTKDQKNKVDTTQGQKPTAPPKGKGKQVATKALSKAGSSKSEEARFTMNEWITLQEDDLFSFGELQCLSDLIVKDNNQSWLRIAGAFYDVTGRRVHPDDIRDKFQQLGAMQSF